MTLSIEKDVAWFKISMKHFRWMHIFEAFEGVIDYVALMNVFKYIGFDHSMQIRLHEVENKVDVFIIFRSDDIEQFDDVFMPVKLLQEHYFSKCPLGICGILESIENLLQGANSLGLFVDHFPHNPIGSLSNLLKHFVLFEHVIFNFVSHFDLNSS